MLSRSAKAAFYALAGPAMAINGALYRRLRAPKPGEQGVRVHLGPGQDKYLTGWINVDANVFTGRADVWADLRNRLPFADNTVQALYSHHVIEHLPDLHFHMQEAFRILTPGGVYRVGGPNGDSAISMYMTGRSEWFSDFPDRRTSLGGRFENFIFCRQEHLTILTMSYLQEIMTNVGFVQICQCLPTKDTGFPDLFKDCLAKEHESDFEYPHTLLVEAVKPAV